MDDEPVDIARQQRIAKLSECFRALKPIMKHRNKAEVSKAVEALRREDLDAINRIKKRLLET